MHIIPAASFGVSAPTAALADGVLTHPHTGLQYRLNPPAAFMWQCCCKPTSVKEVAGSVAREFALAPDEAASAAEAFALRMCELGFLEVADDSEAATLRKRYLRLLKSALVNTIYPEHELRIDALQREALPVEPDARERALRDIRYAQPERFDELVACKADGRNWQRSVTRYSHTMVGLRRLDNLEWCASRVFEDAVAGDFFEAGVCQGGASIFLRALQVAYGESHRRTWVADSFAGLPVPQSPFDEGYDFSEARQPWLAVSLDMVKDNFRTYELLSDNVRFVPGWFAESLSAVPVREIALLRIDADLYQSTLEALEPLYDRVTQGGYIVVDDYHAFPPCRRAVDEFRIKRAIEDPITRIDWTSIYWRKS